MNRSSERTKSKEQGSRGPTSLGSLETKNALINVTGIRVKTRRPIGCTATINSATAVNLVARTGYYLLLGCYIAGLGKWAIRTLVATSVAIISSCCRGAVATSSSHDYSLEGTRTVLCVPAISKFNLVVASSLVSIGTTGINVTG